MTPDKVMYDKIIALKKRVDEQDARIRLAEKIIGKLANLCDAGNPIEASDVDVDFSEYNRMFGVNLRGDDD